MSLFDNIIYILTVTTTAGAPTCSDVWKGNKRCKDNKRRCHEPMCESFMRFKCNKTCFSCAPAVTAATTGKNEIADSSCQNCKCCGTAP